MGKNSRYRWFVGPRLLPVPGVHFLWRLEWAVRTGFAAFIASCIAMGSVTQKGLPALPFLAPVTAVLTTGKTLGGTVKLTIYILLAAVVAAGLVTPVVALFDEGKRTTIFPAVFITSFILALPSCHQLAQRYALLIASVSLLAYIEEQLNGSPSPRLSVYYSLDLARAAAVGAGCSVVALLLPFPRFAFIDVRIHAKGLSRCLPALYGALVEAYLADTEDQASHLRSRARHLYLAAGSTLQMMKSSLEEAYWEPHLPKSPELVAWERFIQQTAEMLGHSDGMTMAAEDWNIQHGVHDTLKDNMAEALRELVASCRLALVAAAKPQKWKGRQGGSTPYGPLPHTQPSERQGNESMPPGIATDGHSVQVDNRGGFPTDILQGAAKDIDQLSSREAAQSSPSCQLAPAGSLAPPQVQVSFGETDMQSPAPSRQAVVGGLEGGCEGGKLPTVDKGSVADGLGAPRPSRLAALAAGGAQCSECSGQPRMCESCQQESLDILRDFKFALDGAREKAYYRAAMEGAGLDSAEHMLAGEFATPEPQPLSPGRINPRNVALARPRGLIPSYFVTMFFLYNACMFTRAAMELAQVPGLPEDLLGFEAPPLSHRRSPRKDKRKGPPTSLPANWLARMRRHEAGAGAGGRLQGSPKRPAAEAQGSTQLDSSAVREARGSHGSRHRWRLLRGYVLGAAKSSDSEDAELGPSSDEEATSQDMPHKAFAGRGHRGADGNGKVDKGNANSTEAAASTSGAGEGVGGGGGETDEKTKGMRHGWGCCLWRLGSGLGDPSSGSCASGCLCGDRACGVARGLCCALWVRVGWARATLKSWGFEFELNRVRVVGAAKIALMVTGSGLVGHVVTKSGLWAALTAAFVGGPRVGESFSRTVSRLQGSVPGTIIPVMLVLISSNLYVIGASIFILVTAIAFFRSSREETSALSAVIAAITLCSILLGILRQQAVGVRASTYGIQKIEETVIGLIMVIVVDLLVSPEHSGVLVWEKMMQQVDASSRCFAQTYSGYVSMLDLNGRKQLAETVLPIEKEMAETLKEQTILGGEAAMEPEFTGPVFPAKLHEKMVASQDRIRWHLMMIRRSLLVRTPRACTEQLQKMIRPIRRCIRVSGAAELESLHGIVQVLASRNRRAHRRLRRLVVPSGLVPRSSMASPGGSTHGKQQTNSNAEGTSSQQAASPIANGRPRRESFLAMLGRKPRGGPTRTISGGEGEEEEEDEDGFLLAEKMAIGKRAVGRRARRRSALALFEHEYERLLANWINQYVAQVREGVAPSPPVSSTALLPFCAMIFCMQSLILETGDLERMVAELLQVESPLELGRLLGDTFDSGDYGLASRHSSLATSPTVSVMIGRS